MHLFNSPWLQEPARRDIAPAYREPVFGPHYGRHAVLQRTYGNAAAAHPDHAVAGDFQAEREILREMARYDRAA